MENLVRLRILPMFSILFFLRDQIQILQYLIERITCKPLNFSEMKIVTPLITLLLALVEVVFCAFIP